MMAFFTIRLIDICRDYSDDDASINDILKNAIPHIFDETWTTYDKEYKNALCFNILRHYLMREICYETVDRWRIALNDELSLIMPKYNLLYAAIESVKENVLGNVNVTETNKQTDTGTNAVTSETNTNGTSVNTNNATTAGANTTTGNSRGNGSTDAWQTSQDTPQGGLTGITNETYLSGAVHNRSTNATETNSTSSGESSVTNTGESSTTDTSKVTGTVDTKINTTTEYAKKIIGKNSGESYVDTFAKAIQSIQSIDQMIIDELEPLFFGLYE